MLPFFSPFSSGSAASHLLPDRFAAILQPGKPSPDVGLLQRMGLAPVRKLRHPVWTPPRAEGTRAPDTRP